MKIARLFLLALIPFSFCLLSLAASWPPVSPDELKMTEEPLAPGASAIILYRQVDRDDSGNTAHEDDFVRIKILKEEGRKYADIEIPFYRESGNNVVHVGGRTVRPDGSVANFEGKPFDKSIVKARGLKYMAKTFTLPDAEVGSVIEYWYTIDFSENYVFDSHWLLSDELFMRRGVFSLKPYTSDYNVFHLRWSWHLLPNGAAPPKEGPDHIIRMEVSNVPAFLIEDFMPPEDELKSRVDFTYSEDTSAKNSDDFWKKRGKKLNGSVESFTDKHKAMEEAVSQIVSSSDAPELKLQKIYARVQQIRNTSYEVEKTDVEIKRDKEKPNANVEDVWKRGYGNGRELNYLFLALARAAGFEAHEVFASDRRHYFFDPALMDAHKLDSDLIVVKVSGKDVFCDPGAAFTPFGMLIWPETAVPGLRVDKDGGSWIQTPLPQSSDSEIERTAKLTLSETGDLEGKLSVTFTGLEALRRRVEERNEDDADRKKTLEDEAKEYIPAATELHLTNKPEWGNSSLPLVAEYDLKIPGWVSGAGRRALLPVGIFSAPEKNIFEHENRVHPIYFEFPFEKVDDVSITLPLGWQIGSLPPAVDKDAKAARYIMKAESDKNTVHLRRQLSMDLLLLDAKYYAALRNFFQLVRTGDEEQVVLQPIGARASN
jgi:uncharacterized protein DUF3857/transglutaminase superfamily protein